MTGFVVDADSAGIILGKKEINMGAFSLYPAQNRTTVFRYSDGHFSGCPDPGTKLLISLDL
jgi:hypothetical protein